MAHQRPIALLCLKNSRRLKIILVEPMRDTLNVCKIAVELADVYISAFNAVAVGV